MESGHRRFVPKKYDAAEREYSRLNESVPLRWEQKVEMLKDGAKLVIENPKYASVAEKLLHKYGKAERIPPYECEEEVDRGSFGTYEPEMIAAVASIIEAGRQARTKQEH